LVAEIRVVRQGATIDLAECLLTAAQHNHVVRIRDGYSLEPSAMIAEADALVHTLDLTREVMVDVTVLRDRVALEARKPLDWLSIDRVFSQVIGDVDGYLSTVVVNLDQLRAPGEQSLTGISALVRNDWTNPDTLRGLGALYLRRAEIDDATPLIDCKRAYAALQASRILDQAWGARHRETLMTKWLRAKALVLAATHSKSVNPFRADLESKRDLLHLAESLLQSCSSEAVGDFYAETRRKISAVTKLRSELLR
jgi:hypothetical protein